jgi:tetratricopeptide (TPR) repeat protein
MSARLPVVRPISWPAMIPQLVVMALAVGLGYLLLRSTSGIVLGGLAYLTYSFGSRAVLLASHRRGMRLLRSGRYDEAVPAFEASYDFFSRNPWVDRLRCITMMSPAALSYREMALLNIAFAHVQASRGAEARASYQRVLREFPDNSLAQAALRLIESSGQPAQA